LSEIGVFDSGAGGLSIAAAIHDMLPGQAISYFADTAFAPYGVRSEAEILQRTETCCRRLLGRPLAALVVASNTATASAIDALRRWVPVPVIGVEPGLKPAAKISPSGVVGVLATRATLASRRYRELLERVGREAQDVRFVEQAGDGWVELVEAGELDTVHARTLVRSAVQPLLDQGADTLVLGCTHYPFLHRAIAQVAGAIPVIETGPAVARELARRLDLPAAPAGGTAGAAAGGWTFLTSADDERFAALAARLLPVLARADQ